MCVGGLPEVRVFTWEAAQIVRHSGGASGGAHGANDLYVALTRATARLGVVHSGDLPPVLARLRPVSLPEAVRRPR